MGSACECGAQNALILKVLERVDVGLTEVKVNLAVVKEKVNLVHRTVHEGNGTPSLITRVALLEQDEDDKRESTKGKYMVWGALITGILSLLGLIVTQWPSNRQRLDPPPVVQTQIQQPKEVK